MAEPMPARTSGRQPANRRPRIPHPHLAPRPEQAPVRDEAPVAADLRADRAEPAPLPPQPSLPSQEPPPQEDTGGWTAVDIPVAPVARPASRSRRGSSRPAPAERTLRSALHVGLAVNLAVLLASRLLPARALAGWSYGGDDFLLAAAVLLSGYTLLAVGRLSRRDERDGREGG